MPATKRKKAAKRKTTPAFVEYYSAVLNGSIVACDKIKKMARKILDDYENQDKYIYDDEQAQRHVKFIELFCYIPSGRKSQKFILEPFQRAMIEVVFGFIDKETGKRKYKEVFFVLGRKNGKTALCSAIAADMMLNDGEDAPQIYFAATSKDQSNLGFNEFGNLVSKSPQLSRHIKKCTSGYRCKLTRGILRSLAYNTNSADGLNTHLAVIDELAAMKSRALYDLIQQSTYARFSPLIFCITTNGFVRNSIFDSQYEYAAKVLNGDIEDEHFLPLIYELDDPDERHDEKNWIKANPGLGTIKDKEMLASNVKKASNDPSYLPTLLVKDFNIAQNHASAWLTIEEIMNPYKPDKSFKEMGFRYGIIGIDAANTTDLNAACMLCMRPNDDRIYKTSMYWMPQSIADTLAMDERRREKDNAPYLQWLANDYIRAYPGNKVGREVFAEWILELMHDMDVYPFAIGYDPWGFSDKRTTDELEAFVGRDRFSQVRQGKLTMSQPLKELKADLGAGRIVDWHNPIDIWCRSNAAIKVDTNGEIQLIKDQNPEKRIDGLVAEANAYIALKRFYSDYVNVL